MTPWHLVELYPSRPSVNQTRLDVSGVEDRIFDTHSITTRGLCCTYSYLMQAMHKRVKQQLPTEQKKRKEAERTAQEAIEALLGAGGQPG